MTESAITLLKGLMAEGLLTLGLQLLVTTLTKILLRNLQQSFSLAAMRRMTGTAITTDKGTMQTLLTELIHNIFVTTTTEPPLRFLQEGRFKTLMRLVTGMTGGRRRMIYQMRC